MRFCDGGDSNKYPKHVFYEGKKKTTTKNKKTKSFSRIILLYSSKFILMTMSLASTAIVETKVHCIDKLKFGLHLKGIYFFCV